MTPRDFVYWLNGYFELRAKAHSGEFLSTEQVELIKSHLALVMEKVTPAVEEIGRLVPRDPPMYIPPVITPSPITGPYAPISVYCGSTSQLECADIGERHPV
jgi:hypothetical protein